MLTFIPITLHLPFLIFASLTSLLLLRPRPTLSSFLVWLLPVIILSLQPVATTTSFWFLPVLYLHYSLSRCLYLYDFCLCLHYSLSRCRLKKIVFYFLPSNISCTLLFLLEILVWRLRNFFSIFSEHAP